MLFSWMQYDWHTYRRICTLTIGPLPVWPKSQRDVGRMPKAWAGALTFGESWLNNGPISQIPECNCSKSQMLYSEQNREHFCYEWSIVGFGTGAFWDLWNCVMMDTSTLPEPTRMFNGTFPGAHVDIWYTRVSFCHITHNYDHAIDFE